jgi:type II secretory pathway component PulF
MPSFQYEALKIGDRSRMTGVINASSEKEARELLREQELMPTKIKIIQNTLNKNGNKPSIMAGFQEFIGKFQGVGLKDKIIFSRNMTMMIRAGIPVTEALMYFENYCKNPKFKDIINAIRRDVLSGYSLSQAMAKHTKVFDDVYVNITQAGERSGELEETMTRMTDLLIKQDKLKGKVISAMVYPAVVVGIMVLVLMVMFLFVIPTFVDVYAKMGVKLPLITQIMVAISVFLRDYWFVSFPMIGASCFGLFKFFTSETGKLFTDRFSLKIPVVSELVSYVSNSHFVSTMHVGFSAGLPILDALFLSTQTVQNTVIKAAFSQVGIQIQTGQKLAVALSQTGHVPDIVLLMLSIGEESGELEKMLENSFEYLEEEVNQRVEILTALMEPLLLLVLGAIVCALALSIYMPLYGMYDKFK